MQSDVSQKIVAPVDSPSAELLAKADVAAKALAWSELTDHGRAVCDWMSDFSEQERLAYRAKALIVLTAAESTSDRSMGTPPDKGLKYNATRMDIVNDFYDEVQRLFTKYRYQREAILALDEIEGLAIWWSNTPAVVLPA